METVFDIGQFVNTLTIPEATRELVDRVKKRRQSLKISQQELSKKSGVSYASVKRFEQIGEISLSSLMKIAMALDCLEDFNKLFAAPAVTSLKDL